MKTNRRFLTAILLMAGFSFNAMAQVPGLPNPSPTQTVSQEIGLGNVSVTYSRPNVKNRKVFGSLVPYDVVWRTGANTATQITFSEDMKLAGHSIPAGTYSLFTIPGKDEWTIIINKAVKEWGAFSYDEKKDLLRFKIKPTQTPEKQESFTFFFANTITNSTDLKLAWDHTVVPMQVTADDDAKITANVEQLMQAEHPSNLIYFNAIQYFYMHDKDIDKALEWVARAKKDVPTNPTYFLFESRLLLKKGDKEGAVKAAEGGIKLATSLKFTEYVKLNTEALEIAKHK